MKKLIGLIIIGIISMGVIGCSSTEPAPEQPKEEKIQKITLSDSDIASIATELESSCSGTAFDSAKFEISLDKSNTLKVDVIKDINDIMTSYKTLNADDTVEAIKKSLTFDTVYEIINEDKKYNGMQVFVFGSEEEYKNNEYYTLKTIF